MSTGEIEIDFARVMERQNQIRNNGSHGLESWLRGMEGVDLYAEFATFEDDHIVNMFTPFMYTRQSYKLFRRAVLSHPTVAELMPWILDDLKPLTPTDEKGA